MSPTSDPANEAPKPSDETTPVRRPVVPQATEASEEPGSGRSPGKTDRGMVMPQPATETADPAKSAKEKPASDE